MKRIVFVFILGAFSSVMCWTQARDGYQNIRWGAPITEVLRAYPNVSLKDDARFYHQDADRDFYSLGVRRYRERNVGGGIRDRSFYFYQGKLFLVSEKYDIARLNIRDTNSLSVRNVLEATYGEFTDMPPYTYQAYGGRFNVQILSCNKTVNKNLRIEIVARFVTGLASDTAFFVDYIDPAVWGQFFSTA
jgi:hypothetical protein